MNTLIFILGLSIFSHQKQKEALRLFPSVENKRSQRSDAVVLHSARGGIDCIGVTIREGNRNVLNIFIPAGY